jgi:Xaa-Pro aminopeptidase
MDEAGVDVLLACSLHNVQYLLGGYRFFLFEHGTVMGVSRYLPIVGYVRGRPDDGFYVGHVLEGGQQEFEPPWTPDVSNAASTAAEAGALAGQRVRARGLERARVGIERSFLPADAHAALAGELPGAQIDDAFEVLEELRAVKRPDELDIIRRAAEGIVDSMLVVFGGAEPGVTRAELADRMRIEEAARGLTFEYCLTSTGRSLNRAPTPTLAWEEGEVCCLDSGGSLHGYVGDLARMASMGPVSPRRADLLEQIDAVQQAGREAVVAGRRGGDIFDLALARQRECPDGGSMDFVAHGMGLIAHEAPRLTSTGVILYPARHAERPLEAGMVLSIETDLRDPEHGFLKLEDTIVVTDDGYEAFGDAGRGWTVAGAAAGAPA